MRRYIVCPVASVDFRDLQIVRIKVTSESICCPRSSTQLSNSSSNSSSS